MPGYRDQQQTAQIVRAAIERPILSPSERAHFEALGRAARMRQIEIMRARQRLLESLLAFTRGFTDPRDDDGMPVDDTYQQCDRCGRKTWDPDRFGREDRMTQPDGNPCGGRFRPGGA